MEVLVIEDEVRLARAHGGRVHVSDSPSGGARFVVELPIAGGRRTDTSQSTPGIR